jgi:hypothetical protein
MMLHRLKLFAIAISALGFSLTAALADEALMDGVRPFMCDDEAIVLLQTDNGWEISTDPTAEIKSTNNGWRFEDTFSGGVWYLREESRNSWVVDGVSENGHFTADCIDLADSVSQVVTTIKPRLAENMMAQLTDTQAQLTDIQAQFADTNEELRKTKDELSKTQTLISEGEILTIQRVQRLCVWMKTYRHLDVLDRSFPFDGKQYKLCN